MSVVVTLYSMSRMRTGEGAHNIVSYSNFFAMSVMLVLQTGCLSLPQSDDFEIRISGTVSSEEADLGYESAHELKLCADIEWNLMPVAFVNESSVGGGERTVCFGYPGIFLREDGGYSFEMTYALRIEDKAEWYREPTGPVEVVITSFKPFIQYKEPSKDGEEQVTRRLTGKTQSLLREGDRLEIEAVFVNGLAEAAEECKTDPQVQK